MARKRRKLDQFLSLRKQQNKELLLEEGTHLSNRIFRLVVGTLLTIGLAGVAIVPGSSVPLYPVGVAVLLSLIVILGALSCHRLHPGLFARPAAFNQFVLLLVSVIAVHTFVRVMGWSPYLTPLPLFAIIFAIAFSQAVGLLVSVGLAFFIGLTHRLGTAATDDPLQLDFPLMLVLTLGAVVSVLGVRRIRRQSQPVLVGFYAGMVQAGVLICIAFMRDKGLSFAELRDPARLWSLLEDPGWGFAGGLISGAVCTCLLPFIERVLGILTERRLLDLADPSNNLLNVLIARAPGTYQHSLGVAQLAANAAEAVGKDALLVRVGAYYHDIGKIGKPEYFVENMGEDKSIHDRLRPSMSKMIIISHVKEGIEYAREERLPQEIIDLIPMHHGTTVVEFFYHKARRAMTPEERARSDREEYRYPGPKPQFPEAGILMLADTMEARAKAETHPNPVRFRAMVQEEIRRKIEDGQLGECDLTIKDLKTIEDSLVRTLSTMHHARIKYPDRDDETKASRRNGENGRGGNGQSRERKRAAADAPKSPAAAGAKSEPEPAPAPDATPASVETADLKDSHDPDGAPVRAPQDTARVPASGVGAGLRNPTPEHQ